MTRITVAIVLSDDFSLCREAVDCALNQDGVDVEIKLFGTCRKTGSALCSDSRVSFSELEKPPVYCELLRVLATRSDSTYVMSIHARHHLLPGALATLVGELDTDAALEMAFALHFGADREGNINRGAYHRVWERAHQLNTFDAASLEDLLTLDFLPQGIRIFRRQSLLSKIFSEPRRYTCYTLVWTLHALLKASFLSKPLCIEKSSPLLSRQKYIKLRDHLARTVSLVARRVFPGNQFRTANVLVHAWRHYWRGCRIGKDFPDWLEKSKHRLLNSALHQFWYQIRVTLLQKLPLVDPRPASRVLPGPKKVGYYIWQYPVLSQTFVQREVAALCRSGAEIVVLSESKPDHDFINGLKPVLEDSARVLPSLSDGELRNLRRRYFRSHPLRYLLVFGYLIGHRYHARKSRIFDRSTFDRALGLASAAEQNGIEHLHAPWADICAFIALLAARMAGISFSVQGRAHDIHRNNYKFGLLEIFKNADFVVTNTRYNVNHIRSILGRAHADKVRLIYNGLNLEQFKVEQNSSSNPAEIRLLCVARLIEQKGLVFLLRACRALLDKGLNVRCDIVGGTEDLGMNYYVMLNRLHRSLRLENNVHFAGAASFDRILTCYREADIFVLPCVVADDGSRDIIPNSVLEAMAMKLPVVSTSVTGLPEMVEHGKTGYLVPPGDAGALADAIRKLYDSPQLRGEFGIAGRRRVERLFDSTKNVLAYQQLFSGMPAKPPRG